MQRSGSLQSHAYAKHLSLPCPLRRGHAQVVRKRMVKNVFALDCICLAILLLASCHKPAQTAEWYQQHEPERQAMLDLCKADPARMSADKDCGNAVDAQFRSGAKMLSASKPR
jgi:hypothetical protein